MIEKYYYSAKTGGFYLIYDKAAYKSGNGWPDDAVAVTDEDYKALFAGQEKGKVIIADSTGKPTLADPVINWQLKAESQRQNLLSEANGTIADWRTELQLEVISDDDKASLIQWMAYIKALKVLDFTGVTDEMIYKTIAWPDKPE
ncbi:tail fiber assembly protein [Erwinia endophytica]|uniref:tail fiber assembly protein n=1 Tax=Erwinia endophytica TaxID=1563158 RepID=UPI001F03CCBE|nr:tail fiber assembly protein [Erwinia endophytica]